MRAEDTIRQQLAGNPILLYLKGTPGQPECGFSARAVAALQASGFDFAYVNVLENPFIREKLPAISRWPTYPQLFVAGELVGGADIIEELQRAGTLKPLLAKALTPPAEAQPMDNREIQQAIAQALPGAEVHLDGEGCDFSAIVISADFTGLPPVRRQQQVLAAVAGWGWPPAPCMPSASKPTRPKNGRIGRAARATAWFSCKFDGGPGRTRSHAQGRLLDLSLPLDPAASPATFASGPKVAARSITSSSVCPRDACSG